MATTDQDDQLVPLEEARAFAALPGCPAPHLSTMRRWATQGLDGVRLEVRVRGARWYTSRRAVRAFLDAAAARRLAHA